MLVQIGEIFVNAHEFHAETFLRVGNHVDDATLVMIDEIRHVKSRKHVGYGIGVEGGKTHDSGDERVDQLVVADDAATEAMERLLDSFLGALRREEEEEGDDAHNEFDAVDDEKRQDGGVERTNIGRHIAHHLLLTNGEQEDKSARNNVEGIAQQEKNAVGFKERTNGFSLLGVRVKKPRSLR